VDSTQILWLTCGCLTLLAGLWGTAVEHIIRLQFSEPAARPRSAAIPAFSRCVTRTDPHPPSQSPLQVVSLHFFTGEPVLMSSGGDNAIKQWIFDQEDGAPRLLRFRSGHAAPPVVVQYYG
jgi:hypothetical protein